MVTDVRVSAALTGSHSPGQGGVRKTCGAIERILTEGTTEYAIRSLAQGSELTRHGGMGGSGLVTVKIDQSNFMVVWDDESTFEAPAPVLDVVGRCLEVTGDVHVRVNAVVPGVAMAQPSICGGSLAAKFTATAFELARPAGEGGIAFRGLAVPAEGETVSLAIFGERMSGASAVPGVLGRALGELSGHCEACSR